MCSVEYLDEHMGSTLREGFPVYKACREAHALSGRG